MFTCLLKGKCSRKESTTQGCPEERNKASVTAPKELEGKMEHTEERVVAVFEKPTALIKTLVFLM